jgi:hypothetical protein
MNKIDRVITDKNRPILQAHHGDMEVVEITADGMLKADLVRDYGDRIAAGLPGSAGSYSGIPGG